MKIKRIPSPVRLKDDHLDRNSELKVESLDRTAIDAMSPGDAVIIFTPDSTHFPIAEYAISKKLVQVYQHQFIPAF